MCLLKLEIKKILTVKPEANIQINGPKGLQEIKITLEEFEESIQTYIEKIKMLIEEVTEEAPAAEADYSSMTVAELKELLKAAGKPVSGKKADLITRLNE